jgi:tryptophan-rich sensory protein
MTSRSLPAQWVGLLGWLLAAFAAGAMGAAASVDAASFYAQLSKPPWAPPAWVFGPVWSALYALMGVAAWLVWRSPGSKGAALGLFGAQLAANALWSWLFFAWHRGALAAVEVVVLLALIVATIAAFRRTSSLAALLLVPYLLWVSFAAVLRGQYGGTTLVFCNVRFQSGALASTRTRPSAHL